MRRLRKIIGEYFCYSFGVRRALIVIGFLFLAGACTLIGAQNPPQTQQQAPPPPAVQQTPPVQAGAAQNPALAQPTAPAAQALSVVVLDAAHGGTDTGARGPSGLAEKDLVLQFATAVGASLRAQGFQVVMTRQDDTDPSFDDRATIANAQRDAIFISLHVGSTGPAGTVRTYTYLFPAAAAAATGLASGETQGMNPIAVQPVAPPAGFLPWRRAQEPYLAQSRKLGDLIQVELAQKFPGSPEISWSAPVYGLRSIAAPAVAVEISSIAADPQQLEAMTSGFADGITRAVMAYKTIYPPGGK